MAILCFVAFELGAFAVTLLFFLLATFTDFLDGYLARKHGQVTQLGRILDPFADKLLVCGMFIYLTARMGLVAPWMTVIIVSRELLVTALRSFVEGAGGDFSARWVGKWKMALQCAAIILCLWKLIAWGPYPAWALAATYTTLLAAVAITFYSGYTYVRAAIAIAGRRG